MDSSGRILCSDDPVRILIYVRSKGLLDHFAASTDRVAQRQVAHSRIWEARSQQKDWDLLRLPDVTTSLITTAAFIDSHDS